VANEHHYVLPLREARVVALKAYFARANETCSMFDSRSFLYHMGRDRKFLNNG
jgi:hypothetical protein